MSFIRKIANKYNNVCKDTNTFKKDYRKRKGDNLQSDIEYCNTKKDWFKSKIALIKESTFMNRFETLIEGKEYKIKSLLMISSIMSTFGIMIKNKWIVSDIRGLHINFELISGTTLICIITSYTFYLIQNKAYKHFNNVPQLLSHFDITIDRKKQKIINIVSIIIVFGVFAMSMCTNVIAFLTFGCDIVTSMFIGCGVDVTCIYCTYYHNKFTSLDGYTTGTDNTDDKKLISGDITTDTIDEIINNTPSGERIKYKQGSNFSSGSFYERLNKDPRVEKKGNKYYKKKVV